MRMKKHLCDKGRNMVIDMGAEKKTDPEGATGAASFN